mmetsp:Transcript_25387/g.29244  ORF Transcript_25387/g.29244 Transcript_25387/m.29244 type:complete len:243 (-) Transcript_25387:2099-2827(-)
MISVNDLQRSLNVTIVPKYYQGINEPIEFELVTVGFKGDRIFSNYTVSLSEFGSSSNLILTNKSKIILSGSKLVINPGVLQTGIKYVLKVTAYRDIWQGMNTYTIYAPQLDYFTAKLSTLNQVTNGDTINVVVAKSSAFSQAINCFIGSTKDGKFAVTKAIGQINQNPIVADITVPYLVKDKVVSYEIAVKCEMNSGTTVNDKSPDIKKLYVKVLTKDIEYPVETQSLTNSISTDLSEYINK